MYFFDRSSNTKYLIVFLAALAGIATVSVAATYKVPHSVTAPGGESTNATYRVHDVIGQSTAGNTSSPLYLHEIGFIPVVRHYLLGSFTAVVITEFTATLDAGAIRLTWAIGASVGVKGFNIYRAEVDGGEFLKINKEYISPAMVFVFSDRDVMPGRKYWYRLGAVDADGEFFSYTVSIITPIVATKLFQNFPNPFNPSTTISFYFSGPNKVSLAVFDAGGRIVRRLVQGHRGFGRHDVLWDGVNDRGEHVGSGVYFYRLTVGTKKYTKKMTLLK